LPQTGYIAVVRQLLLATRNAHKTRELAAMLGPEFSVTDLTARADMPQVEESGSTFEENAALKAVTISRLVPELVVADDSGLEVDALNGAPGVYSARYAGEHATDAENVTRLLAEIDAVGAPGEPAAQFRCVLALARGGRMLRAFDGVVRGVIARSPAGTHGFGYDPIFKPQGANRTFAELGEEAKNAISHRARAVAQLRRFLLESEAAA
jgi:XTP/dITP diphosphohydrolase